MNGKPSVTPLAAGRPRIRRMPVLGLAVGRSRRLCVALVVMHAAAAWSIVGVPVPIAIRAACVLLLLVGVVRSVGRHGLVCARRSVTNLRLLDEDCCELRTRDGVTVTGIVDRSSFVLPWLVVLRVIERGKRHVYSVVVMPDAIDEDDFRRLRTRLRWSNIDISHRGAVDGSL